MLKLILSVLLIYLVTGQDTNTTDRSLTYLVTGPIIGKVTTNTARVLFEFSRSGSYTAILTDANGNQIRSQRTATAFIPIPFAFSGLLPNTRYTVTLSDPTIYMVQSYFTTLSGVSGRLDFATFSCNDQGVQKSKEPEADLWADLLKRIRNNEISYLILTGDQVYMDDPFGNFTLTKPYFACTRILNQTAKDRWNDRKPELLEILRNEYRQTWTIPSIRETLSKIPTLMIADDHEFRDDWGYLPGDYDPNSVDYFYGTLARQVYYEYQRQLREDIDFNNLANIHQDYYYEILNGIGFFFLDYRGIRTWNRPYSQMYSTQLGISQTQLLQQVLDPNTGAFANLNHFFLVSPLTVVFLIEVLVHLGYYTNNDAEESWSFSYGVEQIQLLETLRNWKTAKAGRDLVILDGDVHMAGYTDIYHNDTTAFTQFTSSSMASSAPGFFTFLAFEAIKEVENLNGSIWDYEHHDWTNEFNYGIVLARTRNNSASIGCYLVSADSDSDPELYDSNGYYLDADDWNAILRSS